MTETETIRYWTMDEAMASVLWCVKHRVTFAVEPISDGGFVLVVAGGPDLASELSAFVADIAAKISLIRYEPEGQPS